VVISHPLFLSSLHPHLHPDDDLGTTDDRYWKKVAPPMGKSEGVPMGRIEVPLWAYQDLCINTVK
jgi:hypothetical protein